MKKPKLTDKKKKRGEPLPIDLPAYATFQDRWNKMTPEVRKAFEFFSEQAKQSEARAKEIDKKHGKWLRSFIRNSEKLRGSEVLQRCTPQVQVPGLASRPVTTIFKKWALPFSPGLINENPVTVPNG